MNDKKSIPFFVPPKELWELSDYFTKHFGDVPEVQMDHPNWQAFWQELEKDGVKWKYVSVEDIENEKNET